MRKILIALLAAAMCMSFAACDVQNQNETSGESGVASNETSSETSQEEEPKMTYNIPGAPVDVYDAFKEHSITLKNGSEASFRMFVPDGYNKEAKYPVVLMLHGAGERGDDNRVQLTNATQNLYNDLSSPVYGAIFIVPQCPLNKQWVNQPWTPGKYSLADTPESDEIKTALEILSWAEENYSIDSTRRYAMGISMGGFGVWDLLLRHGDMFASAVIMCGGGGDPTLADTIKDIPIYLAHSKDDTAVAYAGAEETAKALKALGAEKFVFQSLDGYGHNVWNYTSQNVLVMPWMFSHVKEAK